MYTATSIHRFACPVLLLFLFSCSFTVAQNLAQVRSALARGGRSVCPYCWACVHQWNCNRPCRPSYRDYCALCPYRFHCRTTCINLCPFPETPIPTTPPTTTMPSTTTPPTTTPAPTTPPTTTTTPDPCSPNPCPLGGACHRIGDDSFNCTCPPSLQPCDGDWKCTGLHGTCQLDSITCPGEYRSGLCTGSANRRCCLPEGDRRCTRLRGSCQEDGITCLGDYVSGFCSGSASRRCCLPSGTTTKPPTDQSSSSPSSTSPWTTPHQTACSSNPCPSGSECLDKEDGSFNCTCPPNVQTCDGDRSCKNLQGTCQNHGISCPGGYRSGLCSGVNNRRCCLPSDDSDPCLSSSKMSRLQGKLLEYEGMRYTAYDAQPENSYVDWTICVGFNLKRAGARSVFTAVLPGVSFNSVYAGRTSLNRNQCLALFEHDLDATYIPRGRRVAGDQFCRFPTNVKIAIVNAAYRGDLAYSHQTARYIRAGNWCRVAGEYLDYSQYINCRQLGIPGVCTRMDWNAAQFRSMCRTG